MTWEFDTSEPTPAQDGDSARLYPNALIGHLLLVWAIEYVADSPTKFSQPGKPSDVVIVDVVDLDMIDPMTNQPGLVARRNWWRQARLIQELKPSIGNMNPKLCTMGKGQATRGQAPYVLQAMHTQAIAVQRANAWRQANLGFTPSIPTGHNPPVDNPVPQQETELERMARQTMMAQGAPLPPPQGAQKNVYYLQDQPTQSSLPPRPPLPDTPPF